MAAAAILSATMPPAAEESPRSPPADPVPEQSRIHILLVDDEVRNLDVLESVLQSPDYHLVRAASADAALLALLDGEFAALVLDIHLPDMSGLELAHLIKQRKRTQDIPIIFLTAYFPEEKFVLEGYHAGAVDYLTKPVNPLILRSKVAVFVDLFRKTRALVAGEEALRKANAELETRVQARTADLLKANNQLKANEEQLRLITDHAPIFLVQCDTQHRLKFVNRTFPGRFGRDPSQIVGRHLSEIIGPAAYEAIRGYVEATLAGQRVEYEIEVPYENLGLRWIHAVQVPERSSSGVVVGLVAAITDIRARKLAEQELERARDQALAGSRAKDEFLAALSHELRTPLNPVLLLASEAAADFALPPPVRADFVTIRKNIELEARLIDDLLDLTRINSGRLALELGAVDVVTALNDAIDTVRPELASKEISLQVEGTREPVVVVGDAVRLQQVFWNLLSNAVKFTPALGQVAVKVHSPAGARVAVEIADTGIGLTPAETERIFEVFTQGDHAAGPGAQRFGGLGLGLAICRKIAALHSGSIRAESRGRGQGATFILELPLASPGGGEMRPETRVAVTGAAGTVPSGRPRRVLLVEDHEPTRRTLVQLLVRRRFEVVAAATLAEARAQASSGGFDLLVSDLGLPDGDGCTLMSELRDRHGIRGIALTGYGMEHDVARTRAAGFIVHLIKPVRVQLLDGALATLNDTPDASRDRAERA